VLTSEGQTCSLGTAFTNSVAPVEFVEQRLQDVFVTGGRVAVVQGQPRSFGRFDRLRDRQRGALRPDGGRHVLPPLAILWEAMRIAALSSLHGSYSFSSSSSGGTAYEL
jgi:hypothetical protein